MGNNENRIKGERRNLHVPQRKVLILTVLSGEDIGREYILSREEVVIGRDADSDIVVKDHLISRHHTRLAIKRSAGGSDEVVLTDLDSANGTFLNYEPVNRALLKDGDKIMIGATILKLEHRDVYDPQLLDELITLATTDALTGLYNKRQIIALGEEEFARARRYGRPFSLIVAKIDQYRDLSETYDPSLRDQVLRRLGSTVLSCTRQQDKAGRYSDEAFLILLPEARTVDARVVAERLSEHVRELSFYHKGGTVGVTLSMGLSSQAACESEVFVHMVERADQVVYVAQHNGNGLIAVREWAPYSKPNLDGDLEEIPMEETV